MKSLLAAHVMLGVVSALGTTQAERGSFSRVVIFEEPGFPAADSAAPPVARLKALVPGAIVGSAAALPSLLEQTETRLLVLPYGSAFPEGAWPQIAAFLQRGGNLLVLGGRAFTRAAYRDGQRWHLRDYNVRFARALLIDQYQETPGSDGLEFRTNPDLVVEIPRFAWKRAFSPILHLSAVDLYTRDGSAGSLDARLDALAWGTKEMRRMAAPAVQIDHLRSRFAGGRWVFLSAELDTGFWGSAGAQHLISLLTETALEGAEDFTVQPALPLYLPGEPIEAEIAFRGGREKGLAKLWLLSEDDASRSSPPPAATTQLPPTGPIVLPPPSGRGFYVLKAELWSGDRLRAVHRSGFWIRDQQYLRSGPKLSLNKDYFERDGHPMAVVGTTYMASDVQRLFFDHPNVYVWNRDLREIKSAGLNTVRTGWWTGWEKFCDETGRPYPRTLRTLEAYLMTARQHGLLVQFNFFAFLPEVLGGTNPYLDPEARRKQRTLISSVAGRFRDVPFLAWDLINEPSFSQHTWRTRPNGDSIELEEWNRWLAARYRDRAELAAAWNLPSAAAKGVLAVPTEREFAQRGTYSGHNSLKLYDFYLFSQQSFANWVRDMREAIRGGGAKQPITVGQDEGGYTDRLSPAFFAPSVDFTSNHSWWENDSLLWDSLVAKQPGLPALIQETGLQRELTLDEISRRTPESEASLLERKLALSFVQASGAIQWLWNTNAFMTPGNETPIGALRADLTEKPEATVLRDFAKFASALQPYLVDPQPPEVAIITSQAAQFSVIGSLQVKAQQKAVRALAYQARVPGYVISENQLEKLGAPRLAILPSPQALTQTAWQLLLNYTRQGGNLLITGSADRDEHWHLVPRSAQVQADAEVEPVTYHWAAMRLKEHFVPVSFDQQAQSWLEALRFKDGATVKQIPHGKGRIFWAAHPVELAEGTQAAAELYSHVLHETGVTAPFEFMRQPAERGVLIHPTLLRAAVLYVLASERSDDSQINITDKATQARLSLLLKSQRAALALIRKSDGALVAKYGF